MRRLYQHAAIWRLIQMTLEKNKRAMLLWVLSSEGSSPGRKGFCMVVNEQGEFEGTIGGGMMEVKLLELASVRLRKEEEEVVIKEQYHNKQRGKDQSGLICSGKQRIALIPLGPKDLSWVRSVKNGEVIQLAVQKNGVSVIEEEENLNPVAKPNDFYLELPLTIQKTIHIFGGGHVGLALSKVMALQEYQVMVYDDRSDLNTLAQNSYATQIRIIDYQRVGEEVHFASTDIVVIVTSSYRTDKILLQQLYSKIFAYIGMMGSDTKVETLYTELEKEGIPRAHLAAVHAPIGVEIFSKTTIEIAISIAAQIIRALNKDLPTGRKY